MERNGNQQTNTYYGGNAMPSVILNADTTDITAYNGYLIGINAAANTVAVTLPPVSKAIGCKYRFYVVDSTKQSTITSPAANIVGSIPAKTVPIPIANKATIAFAATAAVAGSFVEIVSNGTKYMITGAVTEDTGITTP